MRRIWSAVKKLGLYGLVFWVGCFYGSIVSANAEQARVLLRAVIP